MAKRWMVATLAGWAMGAAACSGGAPGQPDDATGSQVRGGSAREGDFVCTPEGGDADLTVSLRDSAKKLGVVLGLDNVVEDEGSLDSTYRPRPGNANFVRFRTFTALDGDSSSTVSLLVEKPMLEGRAGALKMQQASADDFFQIVYRCEPSTR